MTASKVAGAWRAQAQQLTHAYSQVTWLPWEVS